MYKSTLALCLIASSLMLASKATACLDHYFYQQDNAAYANAISRMAARQAAKEKVFKVKHPAAAVAVLDEDYSLKLDYKLPPASKNVRLQFTATDNVELLDQDIELTNQNGSVTARFRVSQTGIDTITVTISGEHDGEVVSYSSRVYVSTKTASS